MVAAKNRDMAKARDGYLADGICNAISSSGTSAVLAKLANTSESRCSPSLGRGSRVHPYQRKTCSIR